MFSSDTPRDITRVSLPCFRAKWESSLGAWPRSEVPDSDPPVRYHTLIAETGSRKEGFVLTRHREIVCFEANRISEEFLIAYKRELDSEIALPKNNIDSFVQKELNESRPQE